MKTKKPTLLFGAHMSTAGGFEKAIERGESINCTAIQIFTKSNRQWRAKKITDEQAQLFKDTLKKSSIQSVIAHASYLINLGSPNTETVEKSKEGLFTELGRCDQLDIEYLVLHPGSHLKSGEQEALTRIAQNIDVVLSNYTGNTKILLETMAGQGSSVCYTFEHIATILKKSKNKKKLGVCFDTCHVFAAGYEFGTPSSYTRLWQDFDNIIGLKKLKAIHVNDSKKECGSKVDRHEDIGKGKIELKAFGLLFNDVRFFDIPKVLETPRDDLSDYARNMTVIKKLLSTSTKKMLGIK